MFGEYESEDSFCEESVRDFINGTAVQGLKSIEFAHLDKDLTKTSGLQPITIDSYGLLIYWQMAFAREWRKIWDLGIEVAEMDGGFAAVYGEGTFTNMGDRP